MRKINNIVVHCTATPRTTTVESIQNYWKNVLKWKSPGYHIIIKPDGSYVRLATDEQICNGVAKHNANSIHISYIGGVNGKKAIDNRTPAQKKTLLSLLRTMRSRYPDAIIQGHRDFPRVAKECPSFNAKKEYENI